MSEPLPGVLAEIAELIGEASALAIAAEAGGTRIYLPARVTDEHWLVGCIGRAKADKLCAHFSVDGRGQRIEIPLAVGGTYKQLVRAIARRIQALEQDGKSSREIARRVGITQRAVHKQRARWRGTDRRQGRLF